MKKLLVTAAVVAVGLLLSADGETKEERWAKGEVWKGAPDGETKHLENIALGKVVEFKHREPFYVHCTDSDDKYQLTDGEYVKGYFWMQKGTIGWMSFGATPLSMTVDLGKDMPIRGFSYNTAFGTAGVQFPQAIHVYVSLDKENWHFAGDLLSRATSLRVMPPPTVYGTYRAWADDMYCHGRYVKFVAQQRSCTFCDEIEIYKGDDSLLKQPMPIDSTTSPRTFGRIIRWRNRIRRDAERVGAGADASISDRISKLDLRELPEDFKTIVPLNDLHREIFAWNSKNLRKAGYTSPVMWKNSHWDNLDPIAVPAKSALDKKPLRVEMMRGETRSTAINVLNPTDAPIECEVSVAGFTSDTPFDCRDVVFTDMAWFRCVSGALVKGEGDKVKFSIPAGTSKQAWISVRRPTGAAGLRKGTVKAKLSTGATLSWPIEVRVYDLDFPATPRCHAGGWDYLNPGSGHYKSKNLASKLELHREMYIDSPWAMSGVAPKNVKFDKEGKLVSKLDFSQWDEWTQKMHPFARNYCVFLGGNKKFFGEKIGTERCKTMMKEFFTAWGEYAVKNGCADKRIVLLTVDEPTSVEAATISMEYFKGIKSSGIKQFATYTDPIFKEDNLPKIPQDFWTYCDIICPHTVPAAMKPYLKGKEIWLYSAFASARTFDPLAYYRLQPWRAFLAGGKGTFYWALGHGGKRGSWCSYQGGTDYSPYFNGLDDVTPAKQSEAMRESIQDFEYLSMLSDRGAKEEAMKIAKRIVGQLTPRDMDWDVVDPKNREVVEEACSEMLKMLEKLK